MSRSFILRTSWTSNRVFKPCYPPNPSSRSLQTFKRPKVALVHSPHRLRGGSFRTIHLSSVLTPPAVFLGLLVTLWAYKSLMLVVFQNKIIYMPSVPPFSRSEKIEDYAASCRPVVWREERIKAADGTRLALAVGEIPREMSKQDEDESKVLVHRRKRIVVVYFQGYVLVDLLFHSLMLGNAAASPSCLLCF